MTRMILLLLLGVTLLNLQDRVHRIRFQEQIQATAAAGRIHLFGEAAQRYATDKQATRPPGASSEITLTELMLEDYLAPGFVPDSPYGGGDIQLTIITGAFGHPIVQMAVPAPADRAPGARMILQTLDRGGGQVSLQAENGAAPFRMAIAAAGSRDTTAYFSGSIKAGDATGDDQAK